MKFYLVYGGSERELLGAETSLKGARALLRGSLKMGDGYYIDSLDVDVNSETIRRMLADRGGYARNMQTVAEGTMPAEDRAFRLARRK